jgi:hypothetical protein
MAKLKKQTNVRVCQLGGGVCSMSKALDGCFELVQALSDVESSDQDGVPGTYDLLAMTSISWCQLATHCLDAVVWKDALRGSIAQA